MKINIKNLSLEVQDVNENNIHLLSQELSNWQEKNQFMDFVKDIPVSPEDNLKILRETMSDWHNIQKIIIEETRKQIVWFLVLDAFNEEQNSLESYMRVNPDFKGMWIWTHWRKWILEALLSKYVIKKIISFHSARNKASFIINKRSGFKLVDFLPKQTFLPNIGEKTDDFGRELTKEQILKPKGELVDICEDNKEKIFEWLIKHDLIDLLVIEK